MLITLTDGLCLSIYQPVVFRWLTEKEINKLDLAKYKEDSKKSVILEVDLEYPQKLHDLHNVCIILLAHHVLKLQNIYMKIKLKYPNTNQFNMLLQMTNHFI